MMDSAHLVVDLAFCAGVVLAYKGARRAIKGFLETRRRKVEQEVNRGPELTRKLDILLAGVAAKSAEVDTLVAEVLRRAEDKYRSMLQKGREELEQLVEEQINMATERIELRVEGFVRTLRMAAVDTAVDATRGYLREELESKPVEGSGEITSFSDDEGVIKKLH
ncbi:hypothetical protein ANPL_04055 [Anaplasma platys]|uniref:Uncharacterized protein n=1 Tax=Anaplasma platys TaxID=949 RepID=A0A858PZ64_9RICK|nr:hypothetical protein [Anaplasma platys]QJC27857.1 hypothetical protein ANPL_04055 [Anaplasma platys]